MRKRKPYRELTEEQKEGERARRKRYYARNREKCLQAQKQLDAKRSEEISAYKRRWHALQAEADPQYHTNRLNDLKNRRERYKQECTAYVQNVKEQNPCSRCGEADPDVLQFHHLRDKQFLISRGIRGKCSLQTLKKEIEKCIILCSNCHLKLHRQEERAKSL